MMGTFNLSNITYTPGVNPLVGLPTNEIVIAVILIAAFLTLRMYRGIKGTKYSTMNVYRLPISYLAITIISVLIISPSYLDIMVVAAAIIIGYFVGLRLTAGLQFFEKNSTTYYKRSPFIMAVWLISFIARFGIELFIPLSLPIELGVDIILAGTTGMIIGEASHIAKAYKKYVLQPKKEATS